MNSTRRSLRTAPCITTAAGAWRRWRSASRSCSPRASTARSRSRTRAPRRIEARKVNMRHRIALFVCLIVTAFVPIPAEGATAEETRAEINKLAPGERQRRLEDGVRKEGSLTVYSNQGLETIRAYAEGFGKKYPFVKLESTRLQGAAGLDRILLEHRIGKLQVDVVGVDFDNITELLKAGVLGRYDSPEKKNYANQFWDKDGRWYVTDYTLVVIGYNSGLVKPGEAPKGYADLLNPKWKGDISIDTEPEQAVFAWLLDWGEAKTAEYMKALVRNGAVPRRGHTLQVQLLC